MGYSSILHSYLLMAEAAFEDGRENLERPNKTKSS